MVKYRSLEPLDCLLSRALSLDEVISISNSPHRSCTRDIHKGNTRLFHWKESSAAGDSSLFLKRLKRDGLDHQKALEILSITDNSPAETKWYEDAAWIYKSIDSARRLCQSPETVNMTCRSTTIYVDYLVDLAATRLAAECPALLDCLHDDARKALKRMLRTRIEDLLSRDLVESTIRRTSSGKNSRRSGTAKNFNNELIAIFTAYPVLLRICSIVLGQWLNTCKHFVARLLLDSQKVSTSLLSGKNFLPIKHLAETGSDLHNEGQTVLIVTAACGIKIVYKPRSVAAEAFFASLVVQINQVSSLKLSAAAAIDCQSYGWCEFIAAKSCISRDEVSHFYREAGGLLCVMYLLGGSDIHHENLIASGKHPTVVDLEMLFQMSAEERLEQNIEDEAFEAAADAIESSVYSVGLLPSYLRAPGNKIVASGGLVSGRVASQDLVDRSEHSGNDLPIFFGPSAPRFANLPTFMGIEQNLDDYLPEFLEGFRTFSRFIDLDGRSILLSAVQSGHKIKVRRLLRPTRFYSMLLNRIAEFESMMDGSIWSAKADFVSRLSNWDKCDDRMWPLMAAERRALLDLNVPHFTAEAGGTLVSDGYGTTAEWEGPSGLERAERRINSFDLAEQERQVEYILLGTKAGQDPKFFSETTGQVAEAMDVTDCSLNAFQRLNRTAIQRRHSAAWVGLDWLGDNEAAQVLPLGPDLYNGHIGIAMFLAAFYKVRHTEDAAELAIRSIASIRRILRSSTRDRFARTLGVGGAMGLGSVVYGLSAIGEMLNDCSITADACDAAMMMNNKLIESDENLDVLSGSAGAVLGTLALYRRTGHDDVLKRAIACGDHLLKKRSKATRQLGWVGIGCGEEPLTGMSHGAAGFAYAFSALAQASGLERFSQAADVALKHEASLFNREVNNWPTLTFKTNDLRWLHQWCHGSTGIGLSRIGIKKFGSSSERELCTIETAVSACLSTPLSDLDTACCGEMGRLELLTLASDILERNSLQAEAVARLVKVLKRADQEGDFRWNAGSQRYNPGLFRGLAGIGYIALRIEDHSIPSFLIFE